MDVDELLRDTDLPSLSVDAEEALERVRQRAGVRRRRRAVALGGASLVTVMAVVALSVNLVGGDDDGDRRVVAGPGPVGTATTQVGPVGLVDAEVTTGAQGNQRIVLGFSGPLPDASVTEVDGFSEVTGRRVEYLIQPMRELQVCGTTHWFPSDTEGSIDLLIPAGWLDAASLEDVESRQVGGSSGMEKVVVCEPRNGAVQLSFWGMGPTDQAPNVSVSVSDDGRSIVVENN